MAYTIAEFAALDLRASAASAKPCPVCRHPILPEQVETGETRRIAGACAHADCYYDDLSRAAEAR